MLQVQLGQLVSCILQATSVGGHRGQCVIIALSFRAPDKSDQTPSDQQHVQIVKRSNIHNVCPELQDTSIKDVSLIIFTVHHGCFCNNPGGADRACQRNCVPLEYEPFSNSSSSLVRLLCTAGHNSFGIRQLGMSNHPRFVEIYAAFSNLEKYSCRGAYSSIAVP